MKKFLLLASVLALIAAACAQKPAANTANTSPATSGSPKASAPKANEKKPPATNPVPSDWVRMFNDTKGYEFYVPAGTKDESQNIDGVDVYLANVPAPYDIGIIVVAFKDKSLTKEDLLKRTENILTSMGEKDIKITDTKSLSDDYSLANISSVDKDGKTTKGKVLVGTDVTDNYIMLVGTDAAKFAANEKTIDEIWGSFGMYSGGASGNS
ncbi:MAG TPA: hypothetical protein VEM96_01300 [Pyrinomonadaceae bacterium]|nr:hypothetical protein [Pyrinomonadaceae bacterium]